MVNMPTGGHMACEQKEDWNARAPSGENVRGLQYCHQGSCVAKERLSAGWRILANILRSSQSLAACPVKPRMMGARACTHVQYSGSVFVDASLVLQLIARAVNVAAVPEHCLQNVSRIGSQDCQDGQDNPQTRVAFLDSVKSSGGKLSQRSVVYLVWQRTRGGCSCCGLARRCWLCWSLSGRRDRREYKLCQARRGLEFVSILARKLFSSLSRRIVYRPSQAEELKRTARLRSTCTGTTEHARFRRSQSSCARCTGGRLKDSLFR